MVRPPIRLASILFFCPSGTNATTVIKTMNIEPAQVALGIIRKKHFGEWKFSFTSQDILFTKTKNQTKKPH